jgi:hypothetical protein
MFPRDMVCLRNISVDTLHTGDTEDDDDDDDDNNNNNTHFLSLGRCYSSPSAIYVSWRGLRFQIPGTRFVSLDGLN